MVPPTCEDYSESSRLKTIYRYIHRDFGICIRVYDIVAKLFSLRGRSRIFRMMCREIIVIFELSIINLLGGPLLNSTPERLFNLWN